jgi:hypothetical protein
VPFSALLAAVALVLAVAAPATAAEPILFDPVVTPRSGPPETQVQLHVMYGYDSDDGPHGPDYVRVRIGDTTVRMRSDPGKHDWLHGVGYHGDITLDVGTYAVTFEARSHHHDVVTLAAGSITIALPPTPTPKAVPTPTPTPKATPKPKPKPQPKPEPKAEPTARAQATPKPTPRPTPRVDLKLAAEPVPTAPTPMFEPEGPEAALGTPAPSASPAVVAALVPGSTSGGGAVDHPSRATGAGGGPDVGVAPWGPLTSVIAALGIDLPDLPTLPLVPTVVTTTGLAAASMAMGLFGRRRREDDEPDPGPLLAADAAKGVGLGGRALGGPGAGPSDGTDDEDDDDADGPDDDDDRPAADNEAALPRWRRPSLLQARKADPLRTEPAAPRLFFDRGLQGTLAGHERRLIRYTVVRLLDVPDELRGREIGALGEGDEVELLERQGAYWLVACPDGGRGWIHKMTLGATVGGGTVADAPTATLPIAAESWTMGDDVDEDVLAAYLASRRRSD